MTRTRRASIHTVHPKVVDYTGKKTFIFLEGQRNFSVSCGQVHKKPGGSMSRRADPNWPKGCSTP